MRKVILALATMLACGGMAMAQSLGGEWTGKLELGMGRSLKLVLHVDESTRAVTMDSPDQGAYGLKCSTVYMQGDSLSVSIPDLRMSYQGRVADGELRGTFNQGAITLPLSFSPGVKKANRPQTPAEPFPYTTQEVTIDNPAAQSVLAGTLTVPDGCNADTPVVVLVSGSGAQNRDEELFEHKPFAVIADYLARNGIASLRYDDRGFGQSTGDRTDATTQDYAADTKAVIDWLRAQHRFGKVGIIGHSEGGLIAYMLGAAEGGPDFIVSIAGPAVKGDKVLDYQNKIVLMSNGVSEIEATRMAAEAREQLMADPSLKWMHFFLTYDPAQDISRLAIPTMIIYGEKDQQVPAQMNFDEAQRLNPKATVRVYQGLNHMMQHAQTGEVQEYAAIDETFAPEVLADIVAFVQHTYF